MSCSGGKDSTVLLQLALQVDPSIRVYRADPPNPLPDRGAHVARLELAAATASWVVVPNAWDVDAFLAGDIPYPGDLKTGRLDAAVRRDGVDGVAIGIRAAESRGRAWNAVVRGDTYCARGYLVCTPLVTWTAEEVVGYLYATDQLPLNPVYERLHLAPDDLGLVRDGTWLSPEVESERGWGHRDWLAWHYPECVERYDRAVRAVRDASRRRPPARTPRVRR